MEERGLQIAAHLTSTLIIHTIIAMPYSWATIVAYLLHPCWSRAFKLGVGQGALQLTRVAVLQV